MPTATDTNRIAKAHTPLGPKLVFRELTGREELSRLFQYQVELLAENDSGVDPKALLGQTITIELETQGGAPRFVNGICSRFSYAGTEYSRERNTVLYRYVAHLRSWTWLMTLASNCRIFQEKTAPDIVRDLLAAYPFTTEFRLSHSYRQWEYCVQYQETDFNFMSRLLEHEGIYYFFEHSMGDHKLVFCDDIGAHSTLPGYGSIPHIPADMMVKPDEEYIDHWSMSQEVDSGIFVTDDYDFKNPSGKLQVVNTNVLPFPHGDKEVFDWPGGYWKVPDGEQYARWRLEELQQSQETVAAQSNARGLTPGYLFTLQRCPRRDQNREYLLLAVNTYVRDNPYEAGVNAPAGWQFALVAQPSYLPYRPPRITSKPRTTGPQSAVVVGPKHEEIYTDEHGRVKVQFYWDREGKADENSSCWIRVSSTWAGSNWGQISLPRIGQEVIVDFLNGDPDYPVIIGRLYNAEHKPPYALPKWKEYSTIKSRSTQKGGNTDWNEIRFYDYKGKEQVFIHANWRYDLRVKWNMYETIREWRHVCIGHGHVLTVGGSNDHHVKADSIFEINGKKEGTIDKDWTFGVAGAGKQIVKGKLEIYSGQSLTVEAVTSIVLKVGANFIEVSPAGITIQGSITKINSGGGAAGVPNPAYDGVLDCQHADTGEPGYLDRPYKGGGGGRKKKVWVLGHAPPFTVTKQANGDLKLGNGITIKNDPNDPSYQDKVLNDLTTIGSTKTGSTMLNNLDQSGKQTNIHSYTGDPASPNAFAGPAGGNFQDATADGKPVSNGRGAPINDSSGKQLTGTGKGTDVDVSYNPDDWPNNINAPDTPGDVILEHELTHGDHMAHGTYDGSPRTDNFHTNEEFNTIAPENEYRDERGVHRRTDHTDL